MDTWWKYIYDLWLEEGDLRILTYLQKIQRYLEKRQHTQQEILNLAKQIEALLSMEYRGEYTHDILHGIPIADVLQVMRPHPRMCQQDLPHNDDLDGLAEFFENRQGIKVIPQPTEYMFQHPCWILWASLYHDANQCALWAYRKQFIYYMEHEDYRGAARVYQHAVNMKERDDPLPLYAPEVIQHVMYSNLDYFARKESAS